MSPRAQLVLSAVTSSIYPVLSSYTSIRIVAVTVPIVMSLSIVSLLQST